MKIYQADYQEIMDFMINQRWQGYEFVACAFWNGPVSKEELFLFDNHSEAKEFCEEHSTDSDRFGYLPTRSVYRSMSEALQDDSIMVEKGGLVDLLSMVNKYHKKLEERSINENNDFEQLKQKEEVMSATERLKNAPKLKERMFYVGFGAVPTEDLQKKLEEGHEEFQLKHDKKFDKDSTRSILHFEQAKSDVNTYYFNSFDLLLKKEGEEKTIQMNFRTTFGESYKLGEAYRMLSGGAVQKNFVKTDRDDPDNRLEYTAWSYIDFDNKDKQGNFIIVKDQDFDLGQKLAEYPFKDITDDKINSLKKGEQVLLTMETSVGDKQLYVDANPKKDSLNFYNEDKKLVIVKIAEMGESENQANSQTQELKQVDITPDNEATTINNTVENTVAAPDKNEQTNDQAQEQNQVSNTLDKDAIAINNNVENTVAAPDSQQQNNGQAKVQKQAEAPEVKNSRAEKNTTGKKVIKSDNYGKAARQSKRI